MLKNLGIFKDFQDGSLKCVFDKGNNEIIEISLLFNKENIDVVCVPTHHFCNLGCKMCHLTNKGLNKRMKKIEVNDFIEALLKTLVTFKNNEIVRRTNKKQLLISFMGVGEPLLNLELKEDVYKNEQLIKDILGYEEINYAISTMMPNDNILKLIEIVDSLNIPLKLHFSLHTPINKDRKELIPSTKVDVEEALIYLNKYRDVIQKNEIIMNSYAKFHRTNDPIEIHYTLIDNVNDREKELLTLCELLKKYQVPIKFIKFNPTNSLKRSENEKIWINTINDNVKGLRVKTYSPPGRQIGSSCGEFTKHYYHQEIETILEQKEFENWRVNHQVEELLNDYFNNEELEIKNKIRILTK